MLRALLLAAALACTTAWAQKATVCTITVNSADEREVFREYLPADRFDFVELAEPGRREWLGEACRRGVRCDVLVVSGHFAGTDFYSSRHGDHLPVDELERIACGDSCPDLFAHLKEVYLFGCDTLKPEPVRSATPEIVRAFAGSGMPRPDAERLARDLSERHGESARSRMRRVFPGVPLIYGFSSLAPYGRVAGPMLRRHFEAAGIAEVGSGEPSAGLLKLFGPASLVATSGQRVSEPHADYRAEACRYYDDRVTPAQRVAFVHRLLGGDMVQVRMNFDRIERFVAGLDEAARGAEGFGAAMQALAGDAAARASSLAVARETADPALRVRMVGLAHDVGWLSPAEHRAELALMIRELLAQPATGFSEVDLVCGLNRDGTLDAELATFDVMKLPQRAAPAAALACLGHGEARNRVLQAITSADEEEVRVAQAYLRHRPLGDAAEIRALAAGIGRMTGAAAQARALETLARHHVSDAESLEELSRLFARTTSLRVQRAIAEVFIRAGVSPSPELANRLRRHRVRSPEGADLIDVLIERLQAS